jgi:hypothetical protein
MIDLDLRTPRECRCLAKNNLLEQGDTQNLEDGVQAGLELEPLLDDGDEHVHRDGDLELGLHGVLRVAIEGLDPQVLFEPLEEKLHLPPPFVQVGNGRRGEREVVGEEHEPLARVRVEVADPAQALRVALLAVEAVQADGLVGVDPDGSVDRARAR